MIWRCRFYSCIFLICIYEGNSKIVACNKLETEKAEDRLSEGFCQQHTQYTAASHSTAATLGPLCQAESTANIYLVISLKIFSHPENVIILFSFCGIKFQLDSFGKFTTLKDIVCIIIKFIGWIKSWIISREWIYIMLI